MIALHSIFVNLIQVVKSKDATNVHLKTIQFVMSVKQVRILTMKKTNATIVKKIVIFAHQINVKNAKVDLYYLKNRALKKILKNMKMMKMMQTMVMMKVQMEMNQMVMMKVQM